MVASGRLHRDVHPVDRVICGMPTKGMLLLQQLSDMDQEYKKSITMYASVLAEYEKAAERAVNSHVKSLLPNKGSWNPAGRSLGNMERELLAGPLRAVTYYSKLTVRDETTNRLIEYSCTSLSSLPKHVPKQSSSFVWILSHNPVKPQFGCIVALFSHTFAQTTYFWAVVEQFTTSEYDSDLKMWHVCVDPSHKNLYCSSIIKFDQLSHPLVAAIDNNQLWFLNYIYS